MIKRKTVAVIPARLASSRLPGKVLADIHGRPLLWYVWQQVKKAARLDEVLVVTDSDEVIKVVEGWGGRTLLSSPQCRSGTERIASVLDQIPADFILNVQGDEPLIDPKLLDSIVDTWEASSAPVLTAVYPLASVEELFDPNIVKVVLGIHGRALYFSRSPVPYLRDVPIQDWLSAHTFWGHIGTYGYARQVLENYSNLPESEIEHVERLEQLRFLDAGIEITSIVTPYRPLAVDVPADLENVRKILAVEHP